MSKKHKLALYTLLAVGVLSLLWLLLHRNHFAVMNPKGPIAMQQRNLILLTVLLGLVVVVPVFVLLFIIAWRYRESNTKATYHPTWDHSRVLETIWWGVPCAIILVLAMVTWHGTRALDPFKPLASARKPVTIQVVALQWKWLFIYPEQHIASVNLVQFPEQTPVNFEITADAPMNSFWIPNLGGQVYAMSGMSTQLHLSASGTGTYPGSSANISGKGFAGMTFTAKSTSPADFGNWIHTAQQSSDKLSMDTYTALARPSEHTPVALYTSPAANLYDNIIMKYMMPEHDGPSGRLPQASGVPNTAGRGTP